jgi:hypothetical protein
MNYGLIKDESHEAYHSCEAIGAHKLEDLSPYPLLFQKKHVTKEITKDKDSDALRFGRYFHLLALEGEDEASKYFAAAPLVDRRTSAGKMAWAKFQEEAGQKSYVYEEEVILAWRMVKAIREKPSAVALLSAGSPEVTFRHKMASFSVQARVDWFNGDDPAGPLCLNLKSIEHLDQFDRQYEAFNYYKSDAFYRLVVAKVTGVPTVMPQMVNLVVEKNEPFQCAIRTPDPVSLDIGTSEVMADLSTLKACFDSSTWPGEPDLARPVTLSHRKVREYQEKLA